MIRGRLAVLTPPYVSTWPVLYYKYSLSGVQCLLSFEVKLRNISIKVENGYLTRKMKWILDLLNTTVRPLRTFDPSI